MGSVPSSLTAGRPRSQAGFQAAVGVAGSLAQHRSVPEGRPPTTHEVTVAFPHHGAQHLWPGPCPKRELVPRPGLGSHRMSPGGLGRWAGVRKPGSGGRWG